MTFIIVYIAISAVLSVCTHSSKFWQSSSDFSKSIGFLQLYRASGCCIYLFTGWPGGDSAKHERDEWMRSWLRHVGGCEVLWSWKNGCDWKGFFHQMFRFLPPLLNYALVWYFCSKFEQHETMLKDFTNCLNMQMKILSLCYVHFYASKEILRKVVQKILKGESWPILEVFLEHPVRISYVNEEGPRFRQRRSKK